MISNIFLISLFILVCFITFKVLTRAKNKFHKDFTKNELLGGYEYMLNQINQNVKIKFFKDKLTTLLNESWHKFEQGDFSVDGATFLKEQDGNFFNLWWFLHDYRNQKGFISSDIDKEMLDVMILLNVPEKHLRNARLWFNLTFINQIRHYIKGDLKQYLPNNLIKLK